MAPTVDPVLIERAARHGFAGRPAVDVRGAARLTTAVQAQDGPAARLGVRSRTAGVTEADVAVAISARTVVRSWFMRATIHVVDADDVRWLSALFGPSIEQRFRKRWLDMGLTPALRAACEAALPHVLADGPRTRAAIGAALAESGIALPDTDPQIGTHVLLSATAVGLLCRAEDTGRDATFVLLDDWLPPGAPGPRGDDALAELARRYFAAFSPATAADFTTWSGLPARRAVELIRDELTPVEVHGRAGFRLGEAEGARCLRLLAGFDNYLVGYRHRDELLAPALRPQVYVGGIITPALLIDGRITGRWRLTRRRDHADVHVTLFEPLVRAHRTLLEAEVVDISRFLALPTSLTVAKHLTPSTPPKAGIGR